MTSTNSNDKHREKARLFQLLHDELQIETKTFDHQEAPTCEEWMKQMNECGASNTVSLDQVFLVKNLLLRDHKKKSVLIYIMANESTPIDLKALTKTLGFSGSNPLRFAPFDILPDTLNVEKGSLTPLAFYLLGLDKAELNEHEIKVQETMTNIQILIDHNLLTEESKDKRYLFHPLKNTSTTIISRQDFLKFLKRVLGEKLHQQATVFNFESQEKMVIEC